MPTRGGRQRIPRPPGFRAGGPAPWAGVDPAARRLNLEQVRARCAALPPPRRPPFEVEGSVPAAVLVALFERDGEVCVVLEKRTESMPSHQGEIAFPGGRLNPTLDPSPLHGALREAHEEIGLTAEDVEIAGQLDGLATFASRFTITPFVGLLAAPPRLHPDPREVVDVLEVPVPILLEEETFREERWDTPRGELTIFFYELPGETIWGATARILTGLLTFLMAPQPGQVS